MKVVRGPWPGEPLFFLSVSVSADRSSLSAAGELDLAAGDHLGALLTSVEWSGQRVVELELSGVTFIECSCLGILVKAHLRLRERGGRLVLTDVSRAVDRLLTLTGTAGLLLPAAASSTSTAGVLA